MEGEDGGSGGMCRSVAATGDGDYHLATGGSLVSVWFTLQLEDRPGSLARVATALAERGVNITGIVGVAEDTDGALMITTSDATATREVLAGLGLPFEQHASAGGPDAPPGGPGAGRTSG
jgi:hypothetical protein